MFQLNLLVYSSTTISGPVMDHWKNICWRFEAHTAHAFQPGATDMKSGFYEQSLEAGKSWKQLHLLGIEIGGVAVPVAVLLCCRCGGCCWCWCCCCRLFDHYSIRLSAFHDAVQCKKSKESKEFQHIDQVRHLLLELH